MMLDILVNLILSDCSTGLRIFRKSGDSLEESDSPWSTPSVVIWVSGFEGSWSGFPLIKSEMRSF